jgi:hypothetical protein
MFYIYPYKNGSLSVKKLKEALGAKIIKLKDSKYKPKEDDIIINWGNSKSAPWGENMTAHDILNTPDAVALASNKLHTLAELDNASVPVVPYSTDLSVAKEWLESGSKVFARHSLTGHSGEGIEILYPSQTEDRIYAVQEAQRILDEVGLEELADTLDGELSLLADTESVTVPDAPLFTKGVDNCGEYRVHVFNEEVILYQKKSRKVDADGLVEIAEGETADVRNLASHWIYRTENLKPTPQIEELALASVEVLGLHFGAVDIIKDAEGDLFVLEVNTAPGLGNTKTIEAYINAFEALL